MQAQSSRPVQTFTIGFLEAEYNEAEHAKAIAHHLGTAHTELYVQPKEAMAIIPRLPTLYDEPFSDSSQIPTVLICELARRDVTVSLSGDGGDELFGGYERYFWGMTIWQKMNLMPPAVRGLAAKALMMLSPNACGKILRCCGPRAPQENQATEPRGQGSPAGQVVEDDEQRGALPRSGIPL